VEYDEAGEEDSAEDAVGNFAILMQKCLVGGGARWWEVLVEVGRVGDMRADCVLDVARAEETRVDQRGEVEPPDLAEALQ